MATANNNAVLCVINFCGAHNGRRARARNAERNLRRWARAMYSMRRENGACDYHCWRELLAEHRACAVRAGMED